MSITNYGELRAAVANTLSRGDLATGGANVARVPEFVLFAEKRINRSLSRIGAGELGRDSSLATVLNQEWLALPADFNAARALSIIDGSSVWRLDYLTPEEQDRQYPYTSARRPRSFTVLGSDGVSDAYKAWFKPIPDGVYSLRLTYYKLLATLTSGADGGTNWFLTNYPDAYLYAALIEAANFIQDDAAVQKYAVAFDAATDSIKAMDKRRRYTGGTLVRQSSVRRIRGM